MNMMNTEEKLGTTPEALQMAAVVGPRASIQSVKLMNVSAMLGDTLPPDFKFGRHRRGSAFSRRSDDRLEVEIRFALDIATSEEEKSEPSTSIEAKYRLVYKVEDLASIDDEHLRAFSQINGFFNAWPFWRELTTSMLARSQSGFFLLPTLRVERSEEVAAPKS